MTNKMISESVRQFFGGYFHEDWALDAEDWQMSVDDFTVGETSAQLLSLAHQIDEIRAAYREDELGEVMYRDALCSFYPGPLTYHEWLDQVAHRLRERAADVEREP